MKTENAWKKYTDTTEVFQFNEKYKAFISNCKTERECISEMISQAKAAGYRNLDDISLQIRKHCRQEIRFMPTIWIKLWQCTLSVKNQWKRA